VTDTTTSHSATLAWRDQGPLFATNATLSGLEYLRGLIDGTVVAPPVAQVLGIEVIRADEGSVEFSMPVREYFLNHLGLLAGGILSTVMDTALGCSILAAVKPDDDIVTLDLNVDFLRPVRGTSGPVTVTATVVSLGRSRALATCEATDATGQVCAVGKSSCLIRPKRSA
jgi:uncharacterized protein (TIGR00369 family)